jgi:hypothetical protein
LKVEPPDSWKQQPESKPKAVPNASEPVVERPENEVVYLLQSISDRLTKVEANQLPAPTNVEYKVDFTTDELQQTIAQLRIDNHAFVEQLHRKDESINKLEEVLEFRMHKLDELNAKVKIINSFAELLADIIDERSFQES